MDDNTSGQGERAFVPPEIRRWNWGAFLLNWIWGIGNDTYIALLACIPLVNIVMVFVLGAKGSEWAWRNRQWKDVAHFKRVQRNWAIAGVAVLGGFLALFALTFMPFIWFFGHSEAYRTAVAALNTNPVAISELGTPITTGFPWGRISIANDTGSAQLSFSARGPKAEGTAYVDETLRAGHWVVNRLQLEINGRDRRIDLVNRPIASDQPMYPKRVQTITLQTAGDRSATAFSRAGLVSKHVGVRSGGRIRAGQPHLVANAGSTSAAFLVLQGKGDDDFVSAVWSVESPLRVRS